ncbi:MAG: cyclic nucleotide-binding domain-containing protein, partial [Planctomycetota bacterium]|nr:cyclic nucleotide-binding domain-containing protein [Planctomycetota bacterium]
VIIEDEAEGYPAGHRYRLERLQQQGISPLLRIERGRVRNKEIFGNFSLSHGFFRIANSNSHYLVARDGDAFVGAVGFTHDPIDRKVRIFEVIDFSDEVKGFLLNAVDNIAREEMKAEYQEADVSAYAPRMQRTLERLGFVPVAYCPAMVFHDVERLDVVRMAKISAHYDLGRLRLLPAAERIKEIVEKSMEDRFVGLEIGEAARRAEIFQGLPEGDLYHLARIAAWREYPAGAHLIREGEKPDKLYILVEGRAEARSQGKRLGTISAGSIFGEMGLVENTPRTADVILVADSKVIEIEIPRLERLMERHPRLGYMVQRNIAASLSRKLRARDR